MEKVWYSAWLKWLAGLVMMVSFCAALVCGIRAMVAVDSGGVQVLKTGTAPDYEQSTGCIDSLVSESIYAVRSQIQKDLYDQAKMTPDEKAMTIIPVDVWMQSQTENAQEDLEISTDVYQDASLYTEVQPDTQTGTRSYTYRALADWRTDGDVSESESTRYDFFSSENRKKAGNLADHYVEVDASVIIDYIKRHVDISSDDGEDHTQYYELQVGNNTWSYNEETDELYCSRFDEMVDPDVKVYYRQRTLETAKKKLPAGADVTQIFLTQPLCYFNGLVIYYADICSAYQSITDSIAATSTDRVNYRYQAVMKPTQDDAESVVYTNADGDIAADTSVCFTYDYETGETTGNLSENVNFSSPAGYSDVEMTLPSGETESMETYMGEYAKSITFALSSKLTHKDIFQTNQADYERYSYLYAGAGQSLTLTILFCVIGLLCLVYLVLVSGYVDAKGTLTRGLLATRIPTEVVILIAALMISAAVALYEMLSSTAEMNRLFDDIQMITIFAIALCWSIVPFCFELLVRIRHKKFFKNSICYRVASFVLGRPYKWCKAHLTEMAAAMHVDHRLCLMFMTGQLALIFMIVIAMVCAADNQSGLLVFFFFLVALAIEFLTCVVIFRDIRYTAEIMHGVEQLKAGDLDYQIPTEHMQGHKRELAESINHLQSGLKLAVEQSLKDERLKTELITNVSHDIKTPLTSIINYVDLLKKEPYASENAQHYLEVLDQKSQRLKQLMEDLVEVSKSATGNVEFQPMQLDLIELLRQTMGEFEDKFAQRNLEIVENFKVEHAVVNLDSRHTFRIFENLCQNIFKYAMEHSRVYVDVWEQDGRVQVVMKNISQYALNISADELMERFVRGDESRNTSGSGLGLSIARNLANLQQGTFEIVLDGDLFKAIVTFPLLDSQ